MNVSYDYYRIFYYVCRYGSFTKAAQVLKSSQPNITRTMNNLESQLGITLFHRTKSGVVLTEEGNKLYNRISIAFEQISAAENEIEMAKDMSRGIVSFGASDIGLFEIVVPLMKEFRSRFPRVKIQISSELTNTSLRKLADNLIDFAITTGPIFADNALFSIPLMEYTEVPVCAEDYPDYKGEILSLEELSEFPMIMLSEGSATREFYEELFLKNGLVLDPQITIERASQELALVKEGLGVAFLPKSIIRQYEGLREMHLNIAIPTRTICLVMDKKNPPSGASMEMIEFVRNNVHLE